MPSSRLKPERRHELPSPIKTMPTKPPEQLLCAMRGKRHSHDGSKQKNSKVHFSPHLLMARLLIACALFIVSVLEHR
jgi:hypothetical protein